MASPDGAADEKPDVLKGEEDFETLKYQLLGPSLTKAGQDAVDQQKVSFHRKGAGSCTIQKLTRIAGIRNHLQCVKRVKVL